MTANEHSAPQDLSRLKKLKALSERGVVPGERDAAAAMLKKLCAKYGIAKDQINEEEEIKIRWFKHKRSFPYNALLQQCIYKVIGAAETKTRRKFTRSYGGGRTRSEIGVECTAAEAIEIELDYGFYCLTWKDETKRLYDAFIGKNSIFPSDAPHSEDSTFTTEDLNLYQGLKRRTRAVQIGDKSGSKIVGDVP